jgi:glycosyltransferase involved in cell wall biosynthesis
MTTPLTIVIPTKNEAAQIEELVRHLSWAGEVIIADGGSDDETVALARRAGANVLEADRPHDRGPEERGHPGGEQ